MVTHRTAPSENLPTLGPNWVVDRWTVKTDIKFKPRARKAPPEPVWNVADLWELRLNMSIGKEFEFSLGTAKSAIAVRPIMLNSYDVDLYSDARDEHYVFGPPGSQAIRAPGDQKDAGRQAERGPAEGESTERLPEKPVIELLDGLRWESVDWVSADWDSSADEEDGKGSSEMPYLELRSSCSMITPRVCRPGLEVND